MDHPAARLTSCQTSVRSACRDTKSFATTVSAAPLPPARRSRVHTGPMATRKQAAEQDDSLRPEPAPEPAPDLPPELAAALTAFERHLRAERSLSPHTVRAYLGDVSSLLEHARRAGVQAPEGLQATHLRGWLASQHASGAARTTLARRGAAARAFTAFAHRRGWLAADPGPQLGTLKARRVLPHVLRQDEMAAVLASLDQATHSAAAAAEDARAAEGAPADRAAAAEAAVVLRDAAVLELFYATGIRVSELCELDPGHFDYGRRTIRVRGKG